MIMTEWDRIILESEVQRGNEWRTACIVILIVLPILFWIAS